MKSDGLSLKWGKQSSKGANLFHPLWTFPHCLPPSSPFPPYPYYIPLQVQSPPSSLSLFQSFLSLWADAPWYECSRTPPLTDSSLLGTLFCPERCNSVRTIDTRWKDGISLTTPTSAVNGTCQTEGGVEMPLVKVFWCGWIVPHSVFLGNYVQLECVRFEPESEMFMLMWDFYFYVFHCYFWINKSTNYHLTHDVSLTVMMLTLSSVAMGTAAVSFGGLYIAFKCGHSDWYLHKRAL